MNKYIIITITLVVISFAVGRYSVTSPASKVDTSLQTQLQVDKNTHSVTTEVKEVSGEVKKTTTTDTFVIVNKDVLSKTDTVVSKKSTINVSLLGGYNLSDLQPVYGVSVSKEFLGPITIGAFGLTNGIIGVSVGLDF